jgi:hypothetical protein
MKRLSHIGSGRRLVVWTAAAIHYANLVISTNDRDIGLAALQLGVHVPLSQAGHIPPIDRESPDMPSLWGKAR